MARVEVNWHFLPEEKILETQGLALALFDPVPALKFYYSEGNPEFKQCPAFIDSLKNTYVILSPLDIEIRVDKVNNQFELVKPRTLPRVLVETRIGEEHGSPHPIMSLQVLPYLFTSKQDVVMEVIDPWLEWGEKNWRLISGRYNIGKWKRPISFGFEQRERVGTISIKRGQPITYARFFPKGEHDVVELIHAPTTDAIKRECIENIMLKNVVPNRALKYIYSLREQLNARRKRCPIAFMKGLSK